MSVKLGVMVKLSVSNTILNFQVYPSSPRTIIDRRMTLDVTLNFQAAVTVTSTQGYLFNSTGGVDALRAWPLSKCITNAKLRLGNASYSIPLNQVVNAFERIDFPAMDQNYRLSTVPTQPDQFSSYTGNDQQGSSIVGSNRNPLNPYGSGINYSGAEPRGAFNSQFVVAANTTLASNVSVRFQEPLLLSPLIAGTDDSSGFVGLSQPLIIELTLNGQLTNAFSHSTALNAFSSFTASIVSAQLLVTQLQGNLIQDLEVPKKVLYGYNDIQVQSINVGNVTNGSSFTQQSNTIQLSQFPRYILIYIPPTLSSRSYTQADYFATITNLKVTLDNRNNILAECTQAQLYEISVRNGLRMSFPQWALFSGSVIILSPLDLGLKPMDSPGVMNYNSNLQITVTATNNSGQTTNFDLYTVEINDARLWHSELKRLASPDIGATLSNSGKLLRVFTTKHLWRRRCGCRENLWVRLQRRELDNPEPSFSLRRRRNA